jgi:hypothetical protein
LLTLYGVSITIMLASLAGWANKYTIIGKEKGEQGTPHLQGFTVLYKRGSLITVKKLHATAHWERAKGSAQQNRDYCSKEGDVTEWGEIPVKGKSADFSAFASAIASEAKFPAVVREHVEQSIKHFDRALKVHRILHKPDKSYKKPEVVVLWGATGTGKSRRAREFAEERKQEYYVKTGLTEKWWDGYEQEPIVIWDDFRPSNIRLSDLLVLLDGYGTTVQVKGGTVWLKPETWVFTTTNPPDLWYHQITDENMAQLHRRITDVFEFKKED